MGSGKYRLCLFALLTYVAGQLAYCKTLEQASCCILATPFDHTASQLCRGSKVDTQRAGRRCLHRCVNAHTTHLSSLFLSLTLLPYGTQDLSTLRSGSVPLVSTSAIMSTSPLYYCYKISQNHTCIASLVAAT
jgi:hypothetical protein